MLWNATPDPTRAPLHPLLWSSVPMDLRGSLYIGVCEVYRHRILSGTYDMTAIFQHFFLTKKPFRTPTRSYNWRANGAEDQTSALLFDCFPYLFGITERQCLPIREQPSRVKYYTLHRSYCLTVWKVKSFLFLTVLSLDTTEFWIKPFTNPDTESKLTLRIFMSLCDALGFQHYSVFLVFLKHMT